MWPRVEASRYGRGAPVVLLGPQTAARPSGRKVRGEPLTLGDEGGLVRVLRSHG
jgi:hypothetical protein